MAAPAKESGPGQDATSVELNSEFFATDSHGATVAQLDSYRIIREAINVEVDGVGKLLDVGNGGVFEYDTDRVGSIVAVDLFLDKLPPERFPPNAVGKKGDALALKEPEGSFDAVIEAFLYHHVVGSGPADLLANADQAISEAARMLKPGGKLIVAESCVPRWFYAVEWLAFKPLTLLAKTPLLGGHPATMQLHSRKLIEIVGRHLEVEHAERIPTGRWLSQFGRKWPTALTPARPWMVVGRKPA